MTTKRTLRAVLGAPMLLALAPGGYAVARAAPSPTRSDTVGASCGPATARTLASSTETRVYALNGAAYGCAGKRQFQLRPFGYPTNLPGRSWPRAVR